MFVLIVVVVVVVDLQVCGCFPDTMTKCAELLQNEIEMDFMDINVGCPIDLVFKKVKVAWCFICYCVPMGA